MIFHKGACIHCLDNNIISQCQSDFLIIIDVVHIKNNIVMYKAKSPVNSKIVFIDNTLIDGIQIQIN